MKKIILSLTLLSLTGCATNGVGPIANLIYSSQTPSIGVETCQSPQLIGHHLLKFKQIMFNDTSIKPYFSIGNKQYYFRKGYFHAFVSADKNGNVMSAECWKSNDDVPPSVRVEQKKMQKKYMEEQLKKAGLPSEEVQP